MFFLGRTFCGAKNSLDCTPTNLKNVNYIKIQNGIYDEMYLSEDINREYSINIPETWDYDTLIRARFEGDLNGGNVGFILSQVSTVKIKRRIKNTFDWITLYEIPISGIEDLTFERFDKYCRSGLEYEYSAVPVINSVDGDAYSNTVLSKFEGVFIISKDKTYHSILDVDIQEQKNKERSVINTIDRKYPFAISNGQNNYYSGSVSCVFIGFDYDSCQFKVDEGWSYREELMEFLQDGEPKIIKYNDGRIRMISTSDSPSEQTDGHPDKVKTTFNYVEIGNAESPPDLYNNNFIDIDQI